MAKLINCPKCGTLFVQKNKDLCDKCYKDQLALIDEIIEYVSTSPLENVHLKTLIEHFKLTMKEIEHLLSTRRLVIIENKLVFNCIKCNDLMQIDSPLSFICKKCIQEMKQDAIKRLQS